MFKKKFFGFGIVVGMVVSLFVGGTIALAYTHIEFPDAVFTVRSEDQASLEVYSIVTPRNLDFNPKRLIKSVTDYAGNTVDPSEVKIKSISKYDRSTVTWVEQNIDTVLSPEGYLKTSTQSPEGGGSPNQYLVTFEYSYSAASFAGKTPSNTIQKSAFIIATGF